MATKSLLSKQNHSQSLKRFWTAPLPKNARSARALGDSRLLTAASETLNSAESMNADHMPEEVQKFLNGLINEVREDQHRAGFNATAKPRPTSNPDVRQGRETIMADANELIANMMSSLGMEDMNIPELKINQATGGDLIKEAGAKLGRPV